MNEDLRQRVEKLPQRVNHVFRRTWEFLHSCLHNLYRLMWWAIGLAIWIQKGCPEWSLVNESDPDTRQVDGWYHRFEVLKIILTQGWTIGVGDVLSLKETLCYLLTTVSPSRSKHS